MQLKLKKCMIPLVTCVVAACLVTIWGCEVDEDGLAGDSFYINPTSATLYARTATVSMEAVGGIGPFAWTVSDSSVGTITGDTRRVTYVRVADTGVNLVEVRDSRSWTANAVIEQMDTDDDGALSVTPSKFTLAPELDSVTLTATGGIPPYDWRMKHTTLGYLSYPSETQCIFHRIEGMQGTEYVTLSDGGGAGAVARIYVRTSAESIIVSVEPDTLEEDGNLSVLTVNGGDEPYTWTVIHPSHGQIISPSVGESVVYQRTSAGDCVVRMTDDNGDIVDSLISQPSGAGDELHAVVVTGSSTLTTNGAQVVLGAVGGIAPYTWSMVNDTKGHFYGTNVGSAVVYVRDGAGDNAVMVTDGMTDTDVLMIYQP